MTILEQIAEKTRERIEREKKELPLDELKKRAEALPRGDFPFERALKEEGLSYILECKKASPSKGLIDPEFDYLEIAKAYEEAGADAISCLTEPDFFQGSDKYLEEIVESVNIPVLRKDFTIDPYMIYQAKVMGASAILLICALLEPEELRDYLQIADSLGLSALVEAHDKDEIEMALIAGARIIGVNNRNLKDFSVNTENSRALRGMVPYGNVFISESGVRSRDDICTLEEAGVDAVLIGETLMRAEDKTAKLKELKGE